MDNWITVDKAFVDLLHEYGITIDDLLIAIEYSNIDVYSELIKRLDNCTRDIVEFINGLPWKTVALLLFIVQSLYIVNTTGLYKGYRLYPPRDSIVVSFKISFNGLLILLTYLRNLI
ncbi:MAG: hypothetical protein QXH77_04015 [Desulfurococcaceae archaeon]